MDNQSCGKCGAPYRTYSGPWGAITPPPLFPSCHCWNNQNWTSITTTIPTDNETYTNIEIELALRRVGIEGVTIERVLQELDNVKK